jgi:hypothetical protein
VQNEKEEVEGREKERESRKEKLQEKKEERGKEKRERERETDRCVFREKRGPEREFSQKVRVGKLTVT